MLWDVFNINVLSTSVKLLTKSLVGFASVASLVLMVTPETLKRLNEELQKEYGFLKKRLVPALEDKRWHLDNLLIENRVFFGSIFLFFSVVLYFSL